MCFVRNLLILSLILLVPLALGNAHAYTITGDSTGGDCSTIGTWESVTKTCTLKILFLEIMNNNNIK